MNHQRTDPRRLQERRTPRSRSRPSGQAWFTRSRRRFPLFFARIGPVTLSICSVLLISLMAILYLSQQGLVVTTNQQIQALRNQQTALQRQNDDLTNTIATEQSPTYISALARKLGLVPANPQNVQVIANQQIQSSADRASQP